MMLPVEGYEILEHTADLGIRAWGPSIEQAFEQAAWGLIDVIGIRAEGQAGKRTIRARIRRARASRRFPERARLPV